MIKRDFIIYDDFTGETIQTNNYKIYKERINDLIMLHSKSVYYNPFGNETTIFYKPVKVIKEYYNEDENESIEEKTIITTYKNIYNPYSMD